MSGNDELRVRPNELVYAGPALGWILLSHFGDLVTIRDCHVPELFTKIRSVVEDFGLKYIPFDYVAGRTYNGKCAALVGFSFVSVIS